MRSFKLFFEVGATYALARRLHWFSINTCEVVHYFVIIY